MSDASYERDLYDARYELFKRRMNLYNDRQSYPRIEPTPMTLRGYLEHKMADPLVFYGAVIVTSLLTGAIVAFMFVPK